MWLVENHIPLYDEDTLISALELAIGECHRNGLTGIHDAGVSKDDIALYQRAIVAGKFNLQDVPRWGAGKLGGGNARTLLGQA